MEVLSWLKTEFKNQRRYEIVLGVFAGLIFGFGLGWLWKGGPTSSEATKLVDVFIAIGTLGAVVVALGIPLWNRKREREEQFIESLKQNLIAAESLVGLCASVNIMVARGGGRVSWPAYQTFSSIISSSKGKITHSSLMHHAEQFEIFVLDVFLKSTKKGNNKQEFFNEIKRYDREIGHHVTILEKKLKEKKIPWNPY